ncbi:MAG: TRAP transporter substrate-binding protein [Flavobacteriaceae bacterium]
MISNKLGGVALAGALVLALGAPRADAENITLKYSNWLPTGYSITEKVVKPWIADVERVTEGRVKVEFLPKAVGTVPGQYDVIADGLADLSLIVPGYTPGRFPLVEGLELPFLGDDQSKRAVAAHKAYEKFIKPTGELSEVHLVGLFSSNTAHFVMSKAVINKVEDVKGLKVRSPNPVANAALGLFEAVAVAKPASEIYELMSGGIIDGAVFPIDVIQPFKLDGVAKEVTMVPGGLTSTHQMIAMSKQAWEKISEADRKAIEAVSGVVMAERAGKVLADNLAASKAFLKEKGVNVRTVDDAFMKEAKARLAPIRQEWIEKAKKAGLADPEAMLTFVEKESAGM